MNAAEREQRFTTTPLYRDARGYIWQRMRNGRWRATDGCRGEDHTADQPPAKWGPYERLAVIGYDDSSARTRREEALTGANTRVRTVMTAPTPKPPSDWTRLTASGRDQARLTQPCPDVPHLKHQPHAWIASVTALHEPIIWCEGSQSEGRQPPAPARRFTIRFAWYDMWIGAYWDQHKHTLYICPLPCILLTWRRR